MIAYYDGIATQYQKIYDRPVKHINVYTYLSLISNVAGQSILDLGCGAGYYTRMFKPSAKYVLGVDISEKMIEIARQEEAREPLGIEYLVGDVLELGEMGSHFDLVVASFLLHYAQTEEQLLEMCRNIYANLTIMLRVSSPQQMKNVPA
uniref:Methyltransferase domain-containing protein n=1 Tax=Candidatus Kentrum sp. UNK TaxID=2126344 RepID=A0A451B682_9GAMM|nr:MAG: Methyltransferase domain-containing protein [Candidatus Kentron sp. UNK]VFK73747.1 MAG: Methyltransferase domain-containing protein [Candidatus Kentron sp. UNK]